MPMQPVQLSMCSGSVGNCSTAVLDSDRMLSSNSAASAACCLSEPAFVFAFKLIVTFGTFCSVTVRRYDTDGEFLPVRPTPKSFVEPKEPDFGFGI